jgi:hypothetical protein
MVVVPVLVLGIVQEHLTEQKRIVLRIRGFDGCFYPYCCAYGDGLDPDTKNLHGRLLIPRVGQVVGMLFERGVPEAPIACFPLPYAQPKSGSGTDLKTDYEPERLFEIDDDGDYGDILYGHYKGQRIIQRNDGKIEIQSKPDNSGNRTTITLDENGNVKIDLMSGTKIELGQTSLQKVVLETLLTNAWNAAWGNFLIWANAHVHTGGTLGGGFTGTPTVPGSTPALSGHGSATVEGQP